MSDFDKYMYYLNKQCEELITLGERYIKVFSEDSKKDYLFQCGVLSGYIKCLLDNDFIDNDEFMIMVDVIEKARCKSLDIK